MKRLAIMSQWLSLAAIAGLCVVTQVFFRLPSAALHPWRWLLASHLLLAAAAFWPLRHRGRAVTPKLIAVTMALSIVTVFLAVLAAPLWFGHGCWAPDLASLALMLACGIALAVTVSLSMKRLSRLSDHATGCIVVAFLVSLSLATVAALGTSLAARRDTVAFPKAKSPCVRWARTPWEGTWAYLAPRPWLRPNYAPGTPVVSGDLVVFPSLPGKAEILDKREGRLVHSFHLEPSRPVLPGDSAASIWKQAVVSGGHVLMVGHGSSDIVILDLGDKSVLRQNYGGIIVEVAPAGEDGFYVLAHHDRLVLSRLDLHGKLLWSSKPAVSGAAQELVSFEVNPFSPPRYNSRLLPTLTGIICLDSDALFVCDTGTGQVLWQQSPRGRFMGMQLSPGKDVIYAVDSGAAGNRVVAYSAQGESLWEKALPSEWHGLVWASTAKGVVVAPRSATEGSVFCLDVQGKEQWTIPIAPREPLAIEYHNGMVFLVTSQMLSAFCENTGERRWCLEQRQEYYKGLTVIGDTLVAPIYGGLSAHDISSGEIRWVYAPPGGQIGLAMQDGDLFVTSGRGIFAVTP
ncbi:MAG TPA: PQQ-binding-like beta-propeller repeat protein [Firmicutes bacterium]|nr:PQQ-binding-like beta-propeller repeat protein [Bacillota bacterium]